MTQRYPSTQPLILASSSPRRRELLGLLIDDFEVSPADIDETKRVTESPQEYVQRMAQEKAAAVSQLKPDRAVLAADTTVVLGDECLGKPDSADEAAAMLKRMSDGLHQVMSAVALVDESGATHCAINITNVRFANLPVAWIQGYVASGEPMDKAGAYGIQGAAAAWIERIEGSHSGVVGLPLYETAELLRTNGWLK